MMMASSREGYQAKQEGDMTTTMDIVNKYSNRVMPSTTSSRQWSAFRNPRIVRVSRSFGGKDRHSKVCTIRGLRDRRIRLSVPTAVQLYELQDKLGLSQPSKVIDWLLEATKLDIDKLPPLQFPQGFSQFHQQSLFPHHESISASSQLSLGAFYDANYQNLVMAKPRFWDMDSVISSRLKGKEAEKGKWIIKTNEQEEDENDDNNDNNNQEVGGYDHSSSSNNNNNQVSTIQRLFPMGTSTSATHHHHPNLHGLLNINNNAMSSSYSSSYHYSEPSSLSLSQFGSHGLLFPSSIQQVIDPIHPMSGNGVQFASSASPQLFFGPSSNNSATPTPLFSPYAPFVTTSSSSSSSMENNNHNNNINNNSNVHQLFLNSSTQVLQPHYIPSSYHHSFNSTPLFRPFPSPFSSKLLEPDNNNRSQSDNRGSTRS